MAATTLPRQSLCPRLSLDPQPAVLRRWRASRQRHRVSGQAGTDSAPEAGRRWERPPRELRLRSRRELTQARRSGDNVLFAVTMDVDLPPDMGDSTKAETLALEKAYSQDLQRSGRWRHIWQIAGKDSNLSIFDVADSEELLNILWGLPLFSYMRITVTPLAFH